MKKLNEVLGTSQMDPLKEYIINENNFFKNLGIGMTPQIQKWLEDYAIIEGIYKINKDLTINVKGNVVLRGLKHEHQMPEYIQFNKVDGNFGIYGSSLIGVIWSLRGCPKIVTGNFSCNSNKYLSSLEGCPEYVGGDFNCSYCPELKSLEGCPKEVGGDFNCKRPKHKFPLSTIKKLCKVKGKILNKYES